METRPPFNLTVEGMQIFLSDGSHRTAWSKHKKSQSCGCGWDFSFHLHNRLGEHLYEGYGIEFCSHHPREKAVGRKKENKPLAINWRSIAKMDSTPNTDSSLSKLVALPGCTKLEIKKSPLADSCCLQTAKSLLSFGHCAVPWGPLLQEAGISC